MKSTTIKTSYAGNSKYFPAYLFLAGIIIFVLTSYKPGGETKKKFFNGKDLTGWSSSEMGYWSVKDKAIVGHSNVTVAKNQFLWSDVEVKDFYLSVDVLLQPNERNAGIQFRSRKADESGQALGYQADVGQGVWGKLYHEHGRKKLDWTDQGEKAVRKGQWNHYEILAIGHKIWTAINGNLSVAVEDPAGEVSGYIAFQIHSGDGQTVKYRINKLVHNPPMKLAGLNRSALAKQLKPVFEDKP
ncbi:MAG TPA: DUF1080 domain-containing protein [Flavisolibacter sp.]|jgi:hypothetical protein|nr:DUF1080 domain-containing protein [Flavisolibacter sp.]